MFLNKENNSTSSFASMLSVKCACESIGFGNYVSLISHLWAETGNIFRWGLSEYCLVLCFLSSPGTGFDRPYYLDSIIIYRPNQPRWNLGSQWPGASIASPVAAGTVKCRVEWAQNPSVFMLKCCLSRMWMPGKVPRQEFTLDKKWTRLNSEMSS